MAVFASLLPRAGLLAAMLLAATGTLAQEKVGISSAVNPEARGTPPGGSVRQLVIGQDVLYNERVATGPAGQTQLLFLDQSSMSIGPNSDLTIDQFVYDPKTGAGKLAANATSGLLRYVGGKLSKQDGAVTLRTSTATLAVRGGAFILKVDRNGKTEAIFIFGDGLTVTGLNGVAQTLRRPGFEITVAGPGASPSPPAPAPASEIATLIAQLDGRTGGTGGASVIPTDSTVAQSDISSTISGNLAGSLQQAALNTPSGVSPPAFTPTLPTTTLQLQTGANQLPGCEASGSCSGNSAIKLPPPPPPPAPPVTTFTFAGRVKYTNGHTAATGGFVDQSANGNTPYIGGTLSFPPGVPQNGVFTANIGAGVGAISFPLVPGSASFQGTSSSLGQLTGNSFLSSDDTFFYANITPINQPTQRVFIFGGTPAGPGFYQQAGAARIYALAVQPDAALQSTTPFVPAQAGGNLPNGTVSPFYVVAPSSVPFGNNSTLATTPGMQASLAINGQGASQQSMISVTAGQFGSNGQFNGQMVGSSMQSANARPTALNANVSSAVDGNGNSLYGGNNSLSGFVLNQSPAATQTPLGGSPTQYGFTEPALPVQTPTGVGASRTTQALSGSFSGLMSTTAQATPYIVTGGTLISTDAQNNRVQATLAGNALPTQSAGVSVMTMQYGSLSGAAGSQAFVDNNNFSALQSAVNPQQITINGTTSQPSAQTYFVSSAAAGAPTSILPPGVSYCQCQYLQWGYWGGTLTTPATGAGPTRVDAGNINTWVAGVQTPISDINSLTSQSASASYAGHAIGSVFNNGASYVAAGGFNANYNFGTQTGTFAINNFDGHSFSASGRVPLVGANYSFGVNQNGLQGAVNGAFYGPMAANTGGNFAVQSTVGPAYMAAGIYAGAKQ